MKKNIVKIMWLSLMFFVLLIGLGVGFNITAMAVSEPTFQTRPLSDGYYMFASGNNSNKVLDVQDFGQQNGANLQIYQNNRTMNQIFYLKYLGNGYYRITAIHSGKVLDVSGGVAKSGVNVQTYEYNGSNAQLWKFARSGSYYYIKNKLGYYLDNSNGSANNGNNVIVYSYNGTAAQKWKLQQLELKTSKAVTKYAKWTTYLRPETSTNKAICSIAKNTPVKTYFSRGGWTYVDYNGTMGYILDSHLSSTPVEPTFQIKPLSDGYYMFESGNSSNRVLDVQDFGQQNGANLQIYQKNKTMNQIFYLKYIGNGYYSATAIHSGKALDVSGGVAKSGVNVQTYEYNGSNAQLWKFAKSGSYYYIKNKLGYYLDNSNGSTNNGNNVIVYSYNGSAAQKWKLQQLELNTSKAVTKYTKFSTYLRSEASTNRTICSIAKNTAIKTYFTQGSWTYVVYNGNRGYILASHLSSTPVEPTFQTKPLSDGYYMFESGNSSNRVLDVHNNGQQNGANVEIYQKNKTKNQIFYLKYVGNGYYSATAIHSGKALDVSGGVAKSGVNVQTYEYNGSNAQLWKFAKSGSYYYIKNKLGYYLDNSNGSTNNGNNVIVYSYNGSAAQKWKLCGLRLDTSKAVTKYAKCKTYLRPEASTNKSICSIAKNTAIKTYFTQGSWTYVIYKGNRGYIQSKYLSSKKS